MQHRGREFARSVRARCYASFDTRRSSRARRVGAHSHLEYRNGRVARCPREHDSPMEVRCRSLRPSRSSAARAVGGELRLDATGRSKVHVMTRTWSGPPFVTSSRQNPRKSSSPMRQSPDPSAKCARAGVSRNRMARNRMARNRMARNRMARNRMPSNRMPRNPVPRSRWAQKAVATVRTGTEKAAGSGLQRRVQAFHVVQLGVTLGIVDDGADRLIAELLVEMGRLEGVGGDGDL
jgi:hypothetical protein